MTFVLNRLLPAADVIAMPAKSQPLDHEIVRRVLALGERQNLNLYIVGGYLRDILLAERLNKNDPALPIKDLDFAVEGGSASSFARFLASEISAHFVALDEKNDTARVVLDNGVTLDFAGCLVGTIEADVRRRDFTINSFVWCKNTPTTILDFVGGVSDIDNLLIRSLSESVFVEDPLRILRAFRFAALINGTIEETTKKWLANQVGKLASVACERINFELFLLLGQASSAGYINDMAAAGIFELIFPELQATKKVTSNAFHHLGLFDHSVETTVQLQNNLEKMPDWVQAVMKEELSPHVNQLAVTKLACLLHDIGKPDTWVINEEGRHTFYGHDELGAKMCQVIAERMKWSRAVTHLIVDLVKWHLRPGQLFHHGEPSQKAINRFYRTVDNVMPPLLLVALSDLSATCGPGIKANDRKLLVHNLFALLEGYKAFKTERALKPRLLDGSRVMELLKITQGPIVGELLDQLDEAQELNQVVDKSEAEHFVRNLYIDKYGS